MGSVDSTGSMTFEKLCELVAPIAREHGVIRMYLFGSRARGDNGEDSDYDFCVAIPKEYDLFDIGAILYDLKDVLGDDVDLVWEDNIRRESYLEEEILRDRRIVFEA